MSKIPYFLAFMLVSSACFAQQSSRLKENFNKDWKFFLGDDSLASGSRFDDVMWRSLDLPHDWSIEGSFSEKNPAGPEGGALPTGIGWYRKSFVIPADWANHIVTIRFDGVYRNSEVWINGNYLGKRPNGYISFSYDLTHCVKFGKKNVLAVRVDNSGQPNSRWYTGSGIYRNVWLERTNKVHVDTRGTCITTPVINDKTAEVALQVRINNFSGNRKNVILRLSVYNPSGKKVAGEDIFRFQLHDSVTLFKSKVMVQNPLLWSVGKPAVYRLITEICEGTKVLDSYETPFGIRSFDFDASQGFSLNRKPLKLLGVCMHHDLGALGAAVNIRAIERQLQILKEMGCNSIRTSHNPPAPEFLDLCDRMGFLVMDEAFDMWKKQKNEADYHLYWDEWHVKDLEDQVLRDRNHPCIFMWSIGNEIPEQFDSSGIAIALELTAIVKRLDPTRPVTSAITEMDPGKNYIYRSGALDVLGFNYNHKKYTDLPEIFVNQKFISSETMSALATRGHYDMPSDSIRRWPPDSKTKFTSGNPDWTVSAYDNVSAYWGSTHEESWKIVRKLPHIAGLFVWSGFDYLGEPTPYSWPARSSYFGIVDLAGFPKDVYYMYKSEWTSSPVLHVFPHWNWTPGGIIDIWAYYSGADEVELFLNGKSQGIRKKQGDDLHVLWKLKFEPGELKAISRKDGKVVLTRTIRTAGPPVKIELVADRKIISADGNDLSFVTVKILDAKGTLVPDAGNLVKFSVSGEGIVAGVDNGYQASHESFKSPFRRAYNGLCLIILQSKGETGIINVKALSEGLQSASVSIQCR